MHHFSEIAGVGLLVAASIYAVLALSAALIGRWRSFGPGRRRPSDHATPPLTVLKPLCGAEPGLYANLRSFCRQDYPHYQIVFGVRDANDPALAVVNRLIHEHPDRMIDVVISARQHGGNAKVSNLINMMARARHEFLLVADSDVLAGKDYLRSVTAPLADTGVGLVTCWYESTPTAGIWSKIGARFVNDWYMPSVLLAGLFGHRHYASGVALCLRRTTLRQVGGFAAIADHLADDYRLGELIVGTGQRIAVVPYVARMEHHEPSLRRLSAHAVRWMRTVRALQPKFFPLLCVTFSVPLACIGFTLAALSSRVSLLDMSLLGTTLLARLLLGSLPPLSGQRGSRSPLWLLPACDLLVCWAWCRSLTTSRISWRGIELEVDERGVLRSPG